MVVQLISTFDADADGWSIEGDATNSGWQATGGNPGGYFHWVDAATGEDAYFLAPSRFLGDQSIFYGGILAYDIEDTASEYGGVPDVELTGGGLTLVYVAGQAGQTWTHFSVELTASAGWKVGSLSGAGATEAQMQQVLGQLGEIAIRAEYHSGSEEGGLDNVALITADTAPQALDLAVAADKGSLGDRVKIAGHGVVGDTVTVFDGDAPVGTGVVGGDGTWSIKTATLAAGSHTLTATETDSVGNPSGPSAPLDLTITLATPNSVTFSGTSDNNRLTGGGGGDALLGRAGKDRLVGRTGNDTLDGGAGRDRLTGGEGADLLTGGGGKDTFIYQNVSDSGTTAATRDTITGFIPGTDIVDLSAIDADAGADGNQAFTFIDTAAFSHTAGELRYGHSGGNTIVKGDVDGDGAADFSLLLDGAFVLVGTDFTL
jgi:Ca2+-binding RTX toxin-like protein